MKTKSVVGWVAGVSLLWPGGLGVQADVDLGDSPPAPPPIHQEVLQEVMQAVHEARQEIKAGLQAVGPAMELAQAAIAGVAVEAPEPPEPPEPPDVDVGGDHWMHWIEPFTGTSRSASPLIIGTPRGVPMGDLQEDLSIMSRILSKSVQQGVEKDHVDVALGIALSNLPGGRRPECIFWDGHGVMFLMQVRFPLAPTSAQAEEKTDKKADSAWERTRRELYGPKDPAPLLAFGRNKPVAYDAQKVEALKRALAEALKNAGNIRGLQGDDEIIVAVTGTSAGGGKGRESRVVQQSPDGGGVRKEVRIERTDSQGTTTATTMVLKTKKSQVDAYAAGRTDLEEFMKKGLSITTY